VPKEICCRQLVPSATTIAPGARRTAGNRPRLGHLQRYLVMSRLVSESCLPCRSRRVFDPISGFRSRNEPQHVEEGIHRAERFLVAVTVHENWSASPR